MDKLTQNNNFCFSTNLISEEINNIDMKQLTTKLTKKFPKHTFKQFDVFLIVFFRRFYA